MTDGKVELTQKYYFLRAVALADGIVGRDLAVLGAALDWLGRDATLAPDRFWCAEARLVEETGIPRATVNKAIAKLIQLGVLRPVDNADRRARDARTFRVPFECLVLQDRKAPSLDFIRRMGKAPPTARTQGVKDVGLGATLRNDSPPQGTGFPHGGELSLPTVGHRVSPARGNESPHGGATTPVNTPVQDSGSGLQHRIPVQSPVRSLGSRTPLPGSGKRSPKRRREVVRIIQRLDGIARKHPDGYGFDENDWLRLPRGTQISLGWASKGDDNRFVDVALNVLEEHLELQRSCAGDIGVPTKPRPALRVVEPQPEPVPKRRRGPRPGPPPDPGVAAAIRQLVAGGVTQAAIGERLGLTRSFIAAVAQGQRRLKADAQAKLERLVAEVTA